MEGERLKMKRKAIQLAHQTIVVSLPAKWVKQHNIKKGDEIDVEERGRELIIGSKKIKEEKRIEIDISSLDPLINRVIRGLYISGINEIYITFNNPKLIDKIQKEILNGLIGFEIVEQEKNRCVIKNVSEESEAEFDNLLKRIFILIQSMGEEMVEDIEKKETDLEHIQFIDFNVNKFVNFCLRFLNKKGFKEYDKTPSIYSIVQGLENVGDLYKKIANEITESKLKLSREKIEILKDINSLFKEYQHLFYNFDDKKAVSFVLKYRNIKNRAKKMPTLTLSFLTNELIRTIVTDLLANQLTIRKTF